jgi:transcriptional regulator with XRE-family HTH domain
MSGRHPVSELTKGWPAKKLAAVELRKAELREEMVLSEVRKALEISQKELARRLGVGQPAVAKLERRADMHVSRLRSLIETMGGKLRIVAEFPQGSVTITNFADAGEEKLPLVAQPEGPQKKRRRHAP